MNYANEADKSIQAYDDFIFASVGRPLDVNKADTLAAVAALDCRIASGDRSLPESFRAQYREVGLYMECIVN